ncbi:MAG: hypothetical protein AVDCRST_MAG20-2384 [uncultured Acidimicrobiales bacterium]|uniref:Uncharacterized protein n=1 Tax=uncultured Acidimicrobiales bacterium TaxID=310071 RepID=A0A6J4IM83_9ACTN|nr:MAG: hypothetical protein AVDCRST_MAG20-2384 [uncultured Acidimicrobiales bacterium]
MSSPDLSATEVGHPDACPACGTPTRARPGGSQLVGGERLVREIGSCLRCGLQLVRFEGGDWREIRG